jgi:hypothetical protein
VDAPICLMHSGCFHREVAPSQAVAGPGVIAEESCGGCRVRPFREAVGGGPLVPGRLNLNWGLPLAVPGLSVVPRGLLGACG